MPTSTTINSRESLLLLSYRHSALPDNDTITRSFESHLFFVALYLLVWFGGDSSRIRKDGEKDAEQ